MHRDPLRARPGAARAACAAALALAALAGVAQAQMQRLFPPAALRGTFAVTQWPEAELNGRPTRLAPGSRIRNRINLIELPGSIAGQRFDVHYTTDFNGDVKDVWILTPEELAKRPWPTTPEEAARWNFDYPTQTWSR